MDVGPQPPDLSAASDIPPRRFDLGNMLLNRIEEVL
jgi:hypothetical protein